MRKTIALKSLLRAPVKTLLTFLLIAAASFALFSRITDCAVTMREMAAARDVYHGAAALDNTVPDRIVIEYTSDGGRLRSIKRKTSRGRQRRSYMNFQRCPASPWRI